MKKITGLLAALLSSAMLFAQADVHFSQFYETSIIRNPALTGVLSDNFKFTGYERTQWAAFPNPYQTVLLNGQYRLALKGSANDFLSFGLLGYMDRAGDLNQKITAVYPVINYNKCLSDLNKTYLSFGFTGGYDQYSFEPSNGTFDEQFVGGSFNSANPSFETFPNPKLTFFDVGAGINFNTTPARTGKVTYIIGASAYHFNRPSFSYYHTDGYNLNIRWNGNAAAVIDIAERQFLQLEGNYARQGVYQEIVGGGLFGWKRFTTGPEPLFIFQAGVLYRYQDAIVPIIKATYKKVSAGISYDVNISTLRTASNYRGGFEFTLSVSGNYPRREYPKTMCPKF